jgi:SAM-dependent methyltransferase
VTRFTRLFSYDQKRDWDTLALSYFGGTASILDAGCGVGRFVALDPGRITGLDQNPESVGLLEARGLRIVPGDLAERLPFTDDSFGGVYCSHVIEHLHPHELHSLLGEIDRVLAPGGVVAFAAPLLWRHFYSDLTHVRPYNPEVIVNYLVGGSGQRTRTVVSNRYRVLALHWRHVPLTKSLHRNLTKSPFRKALNAALEVLDGVCYRSGLKVFFKKNGYLLVLRKAPGR